MTSWLQQLQNWRREQRNRKAAIKAVTALFLKEHPGERPVSGGVKVRAEEPERYVIWVQWLTDHIPPNYCFYEVEKRSFVAKVLKDDSGYRPAVWR